jgi:hypothetical protein
MPRSRMHGALPPYSPYSYMALFFPKHRNNSACVLSHFPLFLCKSRLKILFCCLQIRNTFIEISIAHTFPVASATGYVSTWTFFILLTVLCWSVRKNGLQDTKYRVILVQDCKSLIWPAHRQEIPKVVIF